MVAVNRHHYRVRAERSEGWWAVSVPELPGAFTQARRLTQVEAMARDLIAFALEVDIDDVSVTVEPVLDDNLTETIDEALAAREDARRATRSEQQALRSAVKASTAQGLTQAEIGQLLDLSHQRIHQLLNRC